MSRPERFDPDHLRCELKTLPATPCYWVGFSGGADSTALLHALLELRGEFKAEVRAVHVNHGLQRDAGGWERQCKAWCEQRDLDLHTEQVSLVERSKLGIEAEARRLRYAVIERLLGPGHLFLTAHHREDQAETVLLNLMRASGVDGLAGMPRTRPLGQGRLARPLLDYPMASLRRYLENEGVAWIEDPSNTDATLDRNFLRHQVLPLLEQRWPGAASRLAQSAGYCRQAAIAVERLVREQLKGMLPHRRILALQATPDEALDFALLVRQWLKLNQVPSLPATRLAELRRQLTGAERGSGAAVAWPGGSIRHFDHCLWLEPQREEVRQPQSSEWSGQAALDLGEIAGTVEFKPAPPLAHSDWAIRFRQGGEKIQLAPDGTHRELKDLLREWRIPPWMRSSVPLLYQGAKLVAIGDLALDRTFGAKLRENGVAYEWTPADALLEFARRRALEHDIDPVRSLG